MKHIFICLILLLSIGNLRTQTPFEVFAGDKKASLDLMFFKFLSPINDSAPSLHPRWLFFNRNRAVVDYKMTSSAFKPQFGFTEAFSYNHEKLKGMAPVVVGQILNNGVYAKAGVQFAHVKKNYTLFTWLVSELKSTPSIDYFLLWRYTPSIKMKTQAFVQVELVNTFPTKDFFPFNFTQRLRLGLKQKSYQCGLGGDFTAIGRSSFTVTNNFGIFLRHEF